MIDDPLLLEVGIVGKPHGLKGEVVVDPLTDRLERFIPGIEYSTSTGTLLMTSVRPHQGRLLAFFEGITDRTSAEAIRGTRLLAPPTNDPNAFWVHEMIGAVMETKTGEVVGEIVGVESNPASDILVTTRTDLVPLTFVLEVVPHEKVIVTLPDGLLTRTDNAD